MLQNYKILTQFCDLGFHRSTDLSTAHISWQKFGQILSLDPIYTDKSPTHCSPWQICEITFPKRAISKMHGTTHPFSHTPSHRGASCSMTVSVLLHNNYLLRSSFFWDVTQHKLVSYRLFGTIYHPGTSITNQYMLRNIPEERRSQSIIIV